MKHALIISALALGLSASAALADCTVQFKAKQGSRYVHTTISVPLEDCSKPAVRDYLDEEGYSNIQVVFVRKDS